jgi:hypothetical protein
VGVSDYDLGLEALSPSVLLCDLGPLIPLPGVAMRMNVHRQPLATRLQVLQVWDPKVKRGRRMGQSGTIYP